MGLAQQYGIAGGRDPKLKGGIVEERGAIMTGADLELVQRVSALEGRVADLVKDVGEIDERAVEFAKTIEAIEARLAAASTRLVEVGNSTPAKFDRAAYQREYMRKRRGKRAKGKEGGDG